MLKKKRVFFLDFIYRVVVLLSCCEHDKPAWRNGRRMRLKIARETVWVRLPPPAPNHLSFQVVFSFPTRPIGLISYHSFIIKENLPKISGGFVFFEIYFLILSRIILAQSIWLGIFPFSSFTLQISGVTSSATYILPVSS